MPSSPPGTAEQRLAAARVGRLASALADGRIYTAVDHKPKATRALRRLDNVRATGRASLLVDHYEEDWSRLWWIRVDGPAAVIESEAALDALAAKYEQYRARRPPGPVIALEPARWRCWIPSQA